MVVMATSTAAPRAAICEPCHLVATTSGQELCTGNMYPCQFSAELITRDGGGVALHVATSSDVWLPWLV